MSESSLQRFVNRLLLRSKLSTDDQRAVLELPVRPMQVRANHDFVRPGGATDHACLIASGIAARFGQTRDGERQLTALHVPGDMADLHSVVLPHPSWALQALSDATVMRIPHGAIRELVDRSPALALAFWRDSIVDSSIVHQWVVSIGRRSAVARLAHLICELAVRLGGAPLTEGVTFDIMITQQHMADLLGLTAVHVNRKLRGLREAGLIALSGRMVTVLDPARLAAVAEFDPAYLHLQKVDDPSPATGL